MTAARTGVCRRRRVIDSPTPTTPNDPGPAKPPTRGSAALAWVGIICYGVGVWYCCKAEHWAAAIYHFSLIYFAVIGVVAGIRYGEQEKDYWT